MTKRRETASLLPGLCLVLPLMCVASARTLIYGYEEQVTDEDRGLKRSVAVTIDDLPYGGGPQNLADAQRAADGVLRALAAHDAPASGFVTGAHVLVRGQVNERLRLLRRWVDAGVSLENHSFSHRSYQKMPVTWYLDDVVRGQIFPEGLMREQGKTVQFFRAPYNHTGASSEARGALETFLEERGLRLAPFTVEHADHAFNRIYVDATERNDSEAMERIGQAYMGQLDTAFAFAEQLTQETLDRTIPQIFLIHANMINADYLEPMLRRLRERGYRFISLEAALQDPAHEIPDRYTGGAGISWLHRWRFGLGMDDRLREEPDPPRWVLDAYRELRE